MGKREIKFRGLTKNGEWVYGSLHTCVGTAHLHGHISGDNLKDRVVELNLAWILVPRLPSDIGWIINDSFSAIEVDPETVGQFTGVCDKDNNPIYEGDLLKPVVNTIGGVIEKPLVQWDDSGVWWLMEKDGLGSYEYLYCLEPITEIEVIGNIHQP